MDDDDLRRGKPTTHKQYGEPMALLVGDALQSLAFQLISQDKLLKSAKQKLQMLHILALASGSRGMAGGQAIDIDSIGIPLTRAELEHMHIQKTGALIRAAVDAETTRDDARSSGTAAYGPGWILEQQA